MAFAWVINNCHKGYVFIFLECDPSCATCYGSSSTQCTTCFNGSLLINSQCILCDESLNFKNGNCTLCLKGYYLNNDISLCTSNKYEQYYHYNIIIRLPNSMLKL